LCVHPGVLWLWPQVGLARLYFHKPAYAVLDEATSAINPDEEGAFYRHLGTLGITAFSIAHRLELRRFHHMHLHFHADGTGGWTMSRVERADAAETPQVERGAV
jgi:ATP-binding cassette subfamily D (ALD) protein 3